MTLIGKMGLYRPFHKAFMRLQNCDHTVSTLKHLDESFCTLLSIDNLCQLFSQH